MTNNKGSKANKTFYSAPALTKGLRVLELLSASSVALSTHEIASKLGYTRNELFRFIAVLEIEGYITKDNGGQGYNITGKLLELSLELPRVSDIFELVSPLANALTRNTGAPCHLVFPSKGEMIVVRRWEPLDRLSISVPVGTRRTMEITASGIVMLCSMSTSDLHAAVEDIQLRNPLFELDSISGNRADLESVGYLKFESRLIEGVLDLSVPLVSRSNQLLGALTVPYANNVTCTSTVEKIGELLIGISTYVSQRLVRT